MKIEKLTREQEARFPEFVDKWTKIGLSADPLDQKAIVKTLTRLYAVANKASAKPIWCRSPLELVLIISTLRSDNVLANVRDNVSANVRANVSDNVRANVRDNVLANVRDNVSDNVRANVSANVSANVLANVRDNVSDNVRDNVLANVRANVSANVLANVRDNVLANVRDNVRDNVSANVSDNVRDNVSANVSDNVRANVSDNVRANVRDNVLANVRANVRDNVRDLLNHYYYDFGQFSAYWLSYYDFANEVFGISNKALAANEAMCRQAGWSFLFWKWAFISEKPLSICRNARGQLHKDGAAALEYSDGFAIYALNGVRVKPCQALTLAEKISPEEVLSETNADVRRELIRKVGVERMLAKIPNKILDKKGNYELLSVRLSDEVPDARYLKMINPSVKCFHVEAVLENISTVESALNYREDEWFKQKRPEVLT